MKSQKFSIPVAIIFALVLSISCGNKGNQHHSGVKNTEPSVIEVKISGMTCTGCEQKIQAGVGKLEGIESVKADHIGGNAIIKYHPGITDTAKIKGAIIGAGYKVIKFIPSASMGTDI